MTVAELIVKLSAMHDAQLVVATTDDIEMEISDVYMAANGSAVIVVS